MTDRVRCFIAADIPEAVSSALAALQQDLKRLGVVARWVPPGNIHLTLKFLGDIPTRNVPAVTVALQEAAESHSSIALATGGVGVFPGVRRARVIWVGLSGEIERLTEFRNDLDARLADIGFAGDARAFSAHLTVGRFRRRPDPAQLREALNRFAGAEFGCLKVREIILFRSELNPGGALYTPLQRVTLGPPV